MEGFLSNPNVRYSPLEYQGPTADQISQRITQASEDEASLNQRDFEDLKQGIIQPKRGLLGKPTADLSQFGPGGGSGGPSISDAIARNITAGNNAASDQIAAGIGASRPTGPTTDIGLGGGPTMARSPTPEAILGGQAQMPPARQLRIAPPVQPGPWSTGYGDAREPGPWAAGYGAPSAGAPTRAPDAFRRPVPGSVITDPGMLQGGPPRIATVADAHAHDQAMSQIQQAAAVQQRPQSGMLAPTASAPQPTQPQGPDQSMAFGMPNIPDYLQRQGIPGVIKGRNGGGFVPGVELAPEAYKAEASAAALGSRLAYQRGTTLDRAQLTGDLRDRNTNLRYGDQYDTFVKEQPAKLATWTTEQGTRYGDQLGTLAQRHGYRSDEIQEIASAHQRTSEALQRFKGSTPNPEQRQGAVKIALGNFVQASGGDPDKAAAIYNSSPDAQTLHGLGLTEDMVRGAADNYRNGRDFTAGVKLESSGMANEGNVGSKVQALPGAPAAGSTTRGGTTAPADLIGAETDINTRARAAAKASPHNADAIEARRQQLIDQARKQYKGGAGAGAVAP